MKTQILYKEYGSHLRELVELKCDQTVIANIDSVYSKLLNEVSNDFTKQIISAIYDLADIYCDAVHHNFEEVANNYSYEEAKQDILFISQQLTKGSLLYFENDRNLINKIINLIK